MSEQTEKLSDRDFYAKLDQFHAEQQQAQASGNSRLANQSYADELAFVEQQKGAEPIAGSMAYGAAIAEGREAARQARRAREGRS